MKSMIRGIFTAAILAFMLPMMIYFWVDVFKNPKYHAPITLDYDKKQAELQQILNTITIGLPPFDERDDHKRTDAQSISITYKYHNLSYIDTKILLENIQKIADTELPAYDTSSHSFKRQFCVGENEISVGDYNFDNLYQVHLYVKFYKYGDCRRWVYENSR
ncbi:hypothetical protein LU290_01080 [Moraxella nasibovis]|uniref:hypothetical protein n=1 Tax=Moraxella nasibovis TaxID=2904120 RepID=UPI00240ECE0C|nr:hypothetical protein [Moraxella nasibovis]WFF38867.1 hypothetical protein LU290_01080 [Moraxella nasibovis]